MSMKKSKAVPTQKTRIQNQNEQIILDAALGVFSAFGYRGATVDQIAIKAGLSKPNLLYYFRRKEDIYIAVLENTLEKWLAPLRSLNPDNDPIDELSAYISAKLELSWRNPAASKLFANEILHGAPHVGKYLKGPLKELVNDKAAVINHWVAQGRIKHIDPYHLIFAIWAVTQHYADFSVQVEALMSGNIDNAQTQQAVLEILLRGLAI
jgi:TetR/AcrR family transcriptional regulator